mgnify:CR=1 FL=1
MKYAVKYSVYVNDAIWGETPIGKLMHDFSCTNPAEIHYGGLSDS